jgi:hypothetical protein
VNLSDELDRWARAYRRDPTPKSKPPANRGGRKAGSRVKSWGECGIKGVTATPSGRYQARIKHQGKNVHLGNFATAAEAGAAVTRFLEMNP